MKERKTRTAAIKAEDRDLKNYNPNSEVKVSQLSPEELAELHAKYGKPGMVFGTKATKSLPMRWYT